MAGSVRSRRDRGWHPLVDPWAARVVAGPPFAIASPLLRLPLTPWSQLAAADLVLPRAVVRRFVRQWRDGASAAQRRWSLRCGRPLPRTAFRPPPRADSDVLLVRRR
ncbi:MAG TPA: hypothetical protein VG756_08435 [Pseudonocardiaceae bacterium]|nr:hypothetical protein [Pseudonocardiaceae bacterium]